MKTVEIFRADGPDVEPVTIHVRHEMPAVPYAAPNFAKQAADRFASEGAALAEALWSSCPGGTVDALIAALLARRASMFRVTFPVADAERQA
jgi:hypothetical protein